MARSGGALAQLAVCLLAAVVLLSAAPQTVEADVRLTNWSPKGWTPFEGVFDVAVDADGRIYAAEIDGDRISKYSSRGRFLGQWGGSGSALGRLDRPAGVAVSPLGLVYVVDSGNNRIQVFDRSGNYRFGWGSSGAAAGLFDGPIGIAIAPDGSVLVADTGNQRIQQFSASGQFLRQWGRFGSQDGEFSDPLHVAVAPSGTVYVTDYGNARIQAFSPTGGFQLEWETQKPSGVATDAAGAVYAASDYSREVLKFSPTGQLLSSMGNPSSFTDSGSLNEPAGVEVEPDGSLLVADVRNQRISRFGADGSFKWQLGSHGSRPGDLNTPTQLAVGPTGQVWVADHGNERVQALSSDGDPRAMFGRRGTGPNDFGGSPVGIAVGAGGDVFLSDPLTQKIEKFSSDGQRLASFAGFPNPEGMDADASGHVYVADSGEVTKLSPDGTVVDVITTTASDPTQLSWAADVAVDSDGDVLVVDRDFPAEVIKFSPNGTFVDAWGEIPNDSLMNGPRGIDVDSAGNVFVADTENEQIDVYTGEGQPLTSFSGVDSRGVALAEPADVTIAAGQILIIDGAAYTMPAQHRVVSAVLDTRINAGPGGVTSDRTPTFSFNSSLRGARFACAVDTGPFAPCGSPHMAGPLADGPHTFWVRASVGSDWRDRSPARRSFTVQGDTEPPRTAITDHPSRRVETRRRKVEATFRFKASESGSRFACRLDARAWRRCTSPRRYTVRRGKHTFRVRATDQAGNTDPTPATWRWTVARR